jgi:ABC-type lipoprotein export system ATPase subunit
MEHSSESERISIELAPALMPHLHANDLRKHYTMGASIVRALDGVSLTVEKGEFVALLGTSGSGKSTLLNLIGGLDKPTSGSLEISGQDLSKLTRLELSQYRRTNVGIIFQSFNLISTMSATDNVSLSMMFANVARGEREKRASSLLESMGLGGRQRHRPKELSGGEQQRVSIARALANQPDMLLADEPTGNLDSRTAKEIMEIIRGLHGRDGKTIILVTHDAGLAERYAQRIVTLMDGTVLSDTRR